MPAADSHGRDRRSPRDFAIALVIVSVLAFVPIREIDDSPRRSARRHSYKLERNAAARLPEDRALDVVILGDSRAQSIDATALCEALPGSPTRCVNAASVAGEWASALGIFEALGERVGPETSVLVFVSDYWLEMGPAGDLELLPRTPAYARVHQPVQALASFVPLSVHRDSRMQALHEWIDETASGIAEWIGGDAFAAREEPRAEIMARLARSNVDKWFVATDEPTRERRFEDGHSTLDLLRARSNRVVLVNLPSSRLRHDYVAAHYPGRHERFLLDAKRLAEASGVPFVDLSDAFDAPRFFRDFHHVRDEHAAMLSRAVADRVKSFLAEPGAGREPDPEARRR